MSTSMQRLVFSALALGVLGTIPALADPPSFAANADPGWQAAELRQSPPRQSNLGGGFIEFLFGGGRGMRAAPVSAAPNDPAGYEQAVPPWQQARGEPAERSEWSRRVSDPRFNRQIVDYSGNEQSGTIIIDTRERLLYLVEDDGKAIRYGIGVGRPGFAWSGVKEVSMKREWPDWTPPDEMLRRRPDLPRYMPGGPDNPLGARALYLGSSLYRIHGSNEPWTIGTAVSSGCIRMRNEDVVDLYDRVKVGTKVVVI
ncbi:MAG TPA: L,D-transpeptidase [Xanthobacteraceae bacterium]|nr:L,D-transpeptidase [Xanthobacteraceae bacterium]